MALFFSSLRMKRMSGNHSPVPTVAGIVAPSLSPGPSQEEGWLEELQASNDSTIQASNDSSLGRHVYIVVVGGQALPAGSP